ncbi:unnamed protein product [Toxocara canis]|uniref:MT domain-containing protein n=1 Tax=Toxocara canis TaxID=6265 RepID=A0A183U3D4_TOXCA|nr:unnamed protein product [Toxocara canis]
MGIGHVQENLLAPAYRRGEGGDRYWEVVISSMVKVAVFLQLQDEGAKELGEKMAEGMEQVKAKKKDLEEKNAALREEIDYRKALLRESEEKRVQLEANIQALKEQGNITKVCKVLTILSGECSKIFMLKRGTVIRGVGLVVRAYIKMRVECTLSVFISFLWKSAQHFTHIENCVQLHY